MQANFAPVDPVPTFLSRPISLLECPISPSRDSVHGACVTGSLVWPSTRAALRHLESLAAAGELPPGRAYLDLSAGTGLLALALSAAAGSRGAVTATELPSALTLLRANADALPADCARIACAGHAWGTPLPPPPAGAPEHLAVACDLLHCAVRDGLCEELAATLAEAALRADKGALIVWEERSAAAEAGLLARAAALGGGALAAGAPFRLRSAGLWGAGVGHPDGSLWLPPSLWPEVEAEEEAEEEEKGGAGGRVVMAAWLKRV